MIKVYRTEIGNYAMIIREHKGKPYVHKTFYIPGPTTKGNIYKTIKAGFNLL